MSSLAAAFAHSARQHPEKIALFWADATHTYADFSRGANAGVRQLRERWHVQPGDRVGVLLRNRPEFVTVLFSILAAGGVAVPINHFLKPPEIAYLSGDAGLKLLITEGDLLETVHEASRITPISAILSFDDWAPADAQTALLDPDACPAIPESLALLVYTSGTTGHPKGAMLTHANLLANVESCRQVLQVVEFDRFVLMLPMFHSFMLTVCILLPLIVGGSIVLIKSVHPPKAMLDEMITHQGTVLPAMAAIFRLLSQLPAHLQLPLRLCISGAGPLPGEILKSFENRYPTVPLIEGYGLTEASPVVAVNPPGGKCVAGSIGPAIPGVEISIRDEAGLELPDESTGELWVRGANVMQGYWNDPVKTAATLTHGWLRTGDLGHRRPDGYFAITDRAKDMLKPNGINVYPREIEEVIQQFAGVKECAVVGEPDERRGERPVAFVALDPGTVFSERALLDWLKQNLADFKLPRRALVLPALPRNATGKILKTELRKMLAEGL
jgi:long-chain acyl-CoA synthetase